MDRAQWLEERKGYIGASEIAAIMGLSRYATPRTVWEDKLGKSEREETLAMRMGRFLEPFIIREGILAAKASGYDLTEWTQNEQTFVHPKVPYFAATPDGFGVYQGERCTLETKFANDYVADNFGHEGSDQCPDEYVVQVVWQMLVTGCKHGFLFALLSNRQVVPYLIQTTPETVTLGKLAMNAGHQFWRCVEDRVMPPLTGRDPDTQYVKQHYSYEDGSITNVDEIELQKVIELKRVEEALACGMLYRDALRNQLREVIGEAAILETPYGEITCKADKNGSRSLRSQRVKLPEEVLNGVLV